MSCTVAIYIFRLNIAQVLATNKLTTMSLNIGYFWAWRPYKLCPYSKKSVCLFLYPLYSSFPHILFIKSSLILSSSLPQPLYPILPVSSLTLFIHVFFFPFPPFSLLLSPLFLGSGYDWGKRPVEGWEFPSLPKFICILACRLQLDSRSSLSWVWEPARSLCKKSLYSSGPERGCFIIYLKI